MTAPQVYETYTPKLISTVTDDKGTVTETNEIDNGGIIRDITKVEASCEITSNITNTNGNVVFNDIKLGENEVIKFRAPNLTTTQTFPAYVYYRFEKGSASNTSGSGTPGGGARYAQAKSLSNCINDIGVERFYRKLITEAGSDNVKTFTVYKQEGAIIDQKHQLTDIFNTAIVIVADATLNNKVYNRETALREDVETYFTDPTTPSNAKVVFTYYPLYGGTMETWSKCIRSFMKLPGDTTFWRLSSTSSYPKGKLVIETGQRLFAQSGDFLQNSQAGNATFICTDLGSDPEYSTATENSDLELRAGDKLFIHYTPSSTNEDGETVSAEPVSLVFEGGDAENPVILKPSGFTLAPSEDVVLSQSISWKKTDVNFGKHGYKNLLALAPNEQIEMRSISRVVLNKPARFYKNFDNERLELGHSSESYSYELKDGEYIFYTDQNTQEAAYYGSGSVVTIAPGAYIPKATEKKEVSDILEQGLHIVPWSNWVRLDATTKVTVTEYQYVTLVEGDTLDNLAVDVQEAEYTLSNAQWTKCVSTEDSPIAYTPAGAETSTVLPKIDLDPSSAPSAGFSVGWEVCSLLELSTSPGTTQTLRTIETPAVKIVDKIKVAQSTGTIEITPQKTAVPTTAAEQPEPQIPYIGPNGNWWIGEVDTGAAAEIAYVKDETWWIGTPTAEGGTPETGKDTKVIAKVPYVSDGEWYIINVTETEDENGEIVEIRADIETNIPAEDNQTPYVDDEGKWCVDTTEGTLYLDPDNNAEVPYINDEGNWQIGTEATELEAKVPYLDEANNKWYIGKDNDKQELDIVAEVITVPDAEVFEPISIKLDAVALSASGSFEKTATDTTTGTTLQMKVFKEEPPKLMDLETLDEVITPISVLDKPSIDLEANSAIAKLNEQWTQINAEVSLWSSATDVAARTPRAIQLNFMIPDSAEPDNTDNDIFGIFSIYLDTDATGTDAGIFIEVPDEYGSALDVISIYNYKSADNKGWWDDGIKDNNSHRLHLRAGLNCIKITKSCSLLIKATNTAIGSILYDNLRLVKGSKTHGINLALLDPQIEGSDTPEAKAQAVLDSIKALDKNHEFYYNVPIENSLAIEFDDNISSFSSPYTLYDINNVNNSFVVSKLDIDYLDTGLKIAKSSKY